MGLRVTPPPPQSNFLPALLLAPPAAEPTKTGVLVGFWGPPTYLLICLPACLSTCLRPPFPQGHQTTSRLQAGVLTHRSIIMTHALTRNKIQHTAGTPACLPASPVARTTEPDAQQAVHRLCAHQQPSTL